MSRRGISLIEVVLSIGIIVMLFGGIYTAYIGILDALANSSARAQAASIANQEVETIRNLPFESVGTIGGVPNGVLPQQKTVTSTDNQQFLITTTVRNIDDPFDGTFGGSPNDTSPADYKLVELELSCITCARFVPLVFTTTVAPQSLEGALTGGSLFLTVFGASAQPIQGATVHVVNASVTPAIDLTDVTNNLGVLQLVGVPTSTQGYQITVSKSGYSSEQTYPIGGVGNPNPIKPHATVAAQTLTQLSFSIDTLSAVQIQTSNNQCQAIPNRAFTIAGSKLIGSSPDVLKFSTSSQTDANGTKTFGSMEWDTYAVTSTGAGFDLVGFIPFSPFLVNPSSTVSTRMVLTTSSVRSVLVTVKDAATGAGITGATVSLSNGAGYAQTRITGQSTITDTDWSGGSYIAQDGGINTEGTPGSIVLSGPLYATSTTHWLISQTIDVGSTTSTFYTLHWNPTTQSGATGANSVRFQIATNNDDVTWNFVGPDGTAGTYYTNPDSVISAVHTNNRYLRYKVYLSTADENVTPIIDDVSIDFYGICVPPYQSYFAGMASGSYTATVTALGYQDATTTITVGSGWQEVVIPMIQ